MPLGTELENGASKEVELDGHLGAHGWVNHSQLVSSENPTKRDF